MTSERTFVDTNVLVYGYDRTAERKREVARGVVADLWRAESGCLSSQVLQEFYVVTTQRLPESLSRARARQLIGRYAAWPVHRVDADDVIAASEVEQRHSVSFWDALLVVAAVRLGADRLLTEDMQHGRTLSGVRIENPFTTSA